MRESCKWVGDLVETGLIVSQVVLSSSQLECVSSTTELELDVDEEPLDIEMSLLVEVLMSFRLPDITCHSSLGSVTELSIDDGNSRGVFVTADWVADEVSIWRNKS